MSEPLPLPARHAGANDLVDLLDRVIDRGAVVVGDIVIGLAGIDLIRLDARLLLVAVDHLADRGRDER
ncbi:gas vesicle protein [Planosporangium thailandense]|uniref:Gas vesicle protein n=1 Tax=Planosporangium thailandense TaxID=765197 RepID=A0ABX0XQS1_9ACTN|nr:gas vesicle protein [Planosporangium thailandense]NJC68326.1 gas vesicle protein [Planosporangium thailandense]